MKTAWGTGGRRPVKCAPSRLLLWLLILLCILWALSYTFRFSDPPAFSLNGSGPSPAGALPSGLSVPGFHSGAAEHAIVSDDHAHLDEHTPETPPPDVPPPDIPPPDIPLPDTPPPDTPASSSSDTEAPPGEGVLGGDGWPLPVQSLPFVEPIRTVVDIPPPVATDTFDPDDDGPTSPPSTPLKGPFVFSDEHKKLLPACSQISRQRLESIRDAKAASVHSHFRGQPIASDISIAAPANICVIVAVPQKLPAGKLFQDSPVPGKWPDTIHLSLQSESVRFSIPPLRALPAQPYARRLFSNHTILYYAELQLPDAGVYSIEAENEAPNWYWAQHGWREAGPKVHSRNQEFLDHMAGMSNLDKFVSMQQMERLLKSPVKTKKSQMFPASITVSARASKPDLPFCYDASEVDANRGKWFRQKDYPHIRSEAADEYGFAYDLDYCRLDYFDEKDTVDCLANKVIHVFGDSNARRFCVALLSGGRWCHNIEAKCQGDERGEPIHKLVVDATGQISDKIEKKHKKPFEIGDRAPFLFGNNSQLWFGFTTSVAYDPDHWLVQFYDKTDYKIPPQRASKKQREKLGPNSFNASWVVAGAHAHPPVLAEKADLVMASMSSWDDAFDVSYGAYKQTLQFFRDTLKEAYPDPKTKFALRLNQGWCCRRNFRPVNMRRFTGTRVQHFGDIARDVFGVKGGLALDGRMSVVDVSALTGRPEVVEAYFDGQMSNNHQKASQIRVENQLLLNSICKRDSTGKAVWKG